MKHRRTVLMALVLAGMAGVFRAQEIPARKLGGGVLPRQPKKISMFPKTYGTSNLSYYRMGANEFTGMQIGATAFDLWSDTIYTGDSTKIRRYGTGGNAFIGTPHLPSGALITGIDIEDCVKTTNSVSGYIFSCEADGDGCTPLTTITSATGCGNDHQDISGSNFVVDNSPDGNYLIILSRPSTPTAPTALPARWSSTRSPGQRSARIADLQ